MARKSAVDYAEDDLGVQSVYEDAQEALTRYQNARSELVGMRSTKRHIEGLITDRESDLAMETFIEGSSASQAAVDRHTKVRIGTDEPLRTLRQQLRETLDDIDIEETKVSLAKAQMEICAARMTELGGYLQYLAVAKSAARTTVNHASPW